MRKTRAAIAAEAEMAARQAASEAGKVLAAKSHEARKEPEAVEPSTFEEAPSKGPKLRPGRNENREAILREIRKDRGEPDEEKPEEKAEKPVEAPPAGAKVEEVAVEAKPAEAVVEAEVKPETPKMVKVKIDGVESEVSESEVEEYGGVKAYQIAKAADNRLAKAREITEESRKSQAQLAQIAELLLKQQQPKTPTVTDDDFIKSKLDLIRFGTPEEGTRAFMEALQRVTPKPVDQGSLVSQAVMAMQRQTAVAEFAKKHQNIVGNPLLLKLAQTLEQEELRKSIASNQPIDWNKLYDTIGVQVSSVAPPRQSQPAATTKDTSTPSAASEKEARKASIINLPVASARVEQPKEEKPETRDESLNRMRKARGQQPQ